MTTMNISLPDEMKAFIEAQIAQEGHASASEYFRALVREVQKRKAKQAKAANPMPQRLTLAELHQEMMASGLITQLPNPAEDIDDDDPDDQPIAIEGEPLSETILRERR